MRGGRACRPPLARPLERRDRRLHARRRERQPAHAGAGGVEQGIRDGGRNRRHRILARAGRCLVRAADQRDLDLRELGEAEHLVALPVGALGGLRVERDLLLERPGDAVHDVPLDLGLDPARVHDDPDVVRDDDPGDADLAGALVHLDLAHRPGVAVLALVLHRGEAAAGGDVALRRRLRRVAQLPAGGLRRDLDHVAQPLVADVAEPERDGIGPRRRRELVDEALVGERVLDPRRRAERAGEERRVDRLRDHAGVRDETLLLQQVTGNRVRVVRAERRERRRARPGRREREPDQGAGRQVRRADVAWAAATRGLEALVVPGDQVAVGVEAALDLHHHRRPVVLPDVLVAAHPLHAHRCTDRLRHQHRVDRGGVGAVEAVAAGALLVDHVHLLVLEAEHLRHGCAERIDALRRRPDGRLVRLHVGDRAGRAHRPVQLVRVVVGRLDDLRRAGERLVDVAVARRAAATAPAASAMSA